jgi:hypothetical protein
MSHARAAENGERAVETTDRVAEAIVVGIPSHERNYHRAHHLGASTLTDKGCLLSIPSQWLA